MRNLIVDTKGKITDEVLLEYLGSDYWQLNKPLVQKLGIHLALWLTHIIQKHEYFKKNNMLDKEGYFYNIQKYIEEETTLNFQKQTEIVGVLKRLRILDVKKKGRPAKNYYKIKIRNLISLITSSGTSYLNSIGLVQWNSGDINKYKRKISNTKTSKIRILEGRPETGHLPKLKKRKNSKIIRSKYRKGKGAVPKPIPKSKALPAKPSKKIQKIINHWNECGLRQHKQPTTKVFKRIVRRVGQILRGVFEKEEYEHRNITEKDIIKGISNFALAAINPLYKPNQDTGYKEHLRREVSLFDFFYNERAYSRNPINKCLFLYYLENVPELVTEAEEFFTPDFHPQVTQEFKNQYVQKILGGGRAETFTIKEENCFRKAGKLLVDFFENLDSKVYLDEWERKQPSCLVHYVFDALEKEYSGDFTGVMPVRFIRPWVYSRILLAYLHSQAMLTD